jgi:hypothetical protein
MLLSIEKVNAHLNFKIDVVLVGIFLVMTYVVNLLRIIATGYLNHLMFVMGVQALKNEKSESIFTVPTMLWKSIKPH